jgi:hypothetical protein
MDKIGGQALGAWWTTSRPASMWPSELAPIAKITGSRVWDHSAGWDRAPFTSGSHKQVAVFQKLPQPPARADPPDMSV